MSTKHPLVLAVLGAALLALVGAPTTSAHEGNFHGSLRVHDSRVSEPAVAHDSFVSCTFWVEGFRLGAASGTLVLWGLPPTGDAPMRFAQETPWTGVEESDGGYHINVGPLSLPPGRYLAEAFLDGDREHSAKAKAFHVRSCDERLACTDARVTARDDGAIALDWTRVEGADAYTVRRAESGTKPLVTLATTSETHFLDTSAMPGITYRYVVDARAADGRVSEECTQLDATAIPYFAGPAALVLASLGAVGTLVAARRRR